MRSLTTLLLLSFSTLIVAKNDFPNEVVVTSADVVDGEIKSFGKAGEKYRLYSIYGAGSSDDQVKQVSITDSEGKVFKFADLHKAGAFFLSENNIVTGPLKVTDPTLPIQTRKRSVAFRLTYTIYLVSTKVTALPVADSIETWQHMTMNSDDYNGKQEVKGVTLLSAEKFFTLRNIKFSADAAYIIPRGYDLQPASTEDSVMDLTQKSSYSSFITIFGPIATILNKDRTKTGRFEIGFDLATAECPPEGLEPGASFTLLSPNWLSRDESYSTSFQSYSEAFDRTFTYKDDSLLNFQLLTSNFDFGEDISLRITDKKGVANQYGHGASGKSEISDAVVGNNIHLKATVTSLPNPSTYPRFIMKVTSNTDLTATTEKAMATTSGVGNGSIFFALLLIMVVSRG